MSRVKGRHCAGLPTEDANTIVMSTFEIPKSACRVRGRKHSVLVEIEDHIFLGSLSEVVMRGRRGSQAKPMGGSHEQRDQRALSETRACCFRRCLLADLSARPRVACGLG